MRYRPDVEARGITRLVFADIVKRREFQILYVAMFTGLAAGFAVNANLKEFSPEQNLRIGIMAVSLFAIANALGRVTWGFIFDRIRSATAIRTNLIFQAVVLIIALWLLKGAAGLLVFAFLTGFNYGGVLVIYASSTARIWGDESVGQVYGLLFSANILAALSPILAGFVYDAFDSFNLAITILAVMMVAAALWVWKNNSAINVA
jgi:OFA family oxalate/formate antiporter-like MFS transporter